MNLIRLPLFFSVVFFITSIIIFYFNFSDIFYVIEDYDLLLFLSHFIYFSLLFALSYFCALICLLFRYNIERFTLKNVLLVALMAILIAILNFLMKNDFYSSLTLDFLVIFGFIDGFSHLFDRTNKQASRGLVIAPNIIYLLFCTSSVIAYEWLDLYIITPNNKQILNEYNLMNGHLSEIFQNMPLIGLIRIFVSFILLFFITKGLFKKYYSEMPIGDIIRVIGRIWVRLLLAGIVMSLVAIVPIVFLRINNVTVLLGLISIVMLIYYIKITRSAVRKYFYQLESV